MADDLTERIARAIAAVYGEEGAFGKRPLDCETNGRCACCALIRKEARKRARAAIAATKAALREPTEAMVEAGANCAREHRKQYGQPRDTAADVWRAMLDASPKE